MPNATVPTETVDPEVVDATIHRLASTTFGDTDAVRDLFDALLPQLRRYVAAADKERFAGVVWMNFSGGTTCHWFADEVWAELGLAAIS